MPTLLLFAARGRGFFFNFDHFHAAVIAAVAADLVRAVLLPAFGAFAKRGSFQEIVGAAHAFARNRVPAFGMSHVKTTFFPAGPSACAAPTKAAAS